VQSKYITFMILVYLLRFWHTKHTDRSGHIMAARCFITGSYLRTPQPSKQFQNDSQVQL